MAACRASLFPRATLFPANADLPADALIQLGENTLNSLSGRRHVAIRAGRALDEPLSLEHRPLLHGGPVAQEHARQRDPAPALDVPLLALLVVHPGGEHRRL